MKTFDFYEFTGVLCPGAVVLFSLSLVVPEFGMLFLNQSVTVGDLGLFVILSYVAGHLVQALGTLLETGFWLSLGGKPTDWVRTGKRALLSTTQLDLLKRRIARQTGSALDALDGKAWSAITRSLDIAIDRAGRAKRTHMFNGNYAMFRGLSAAFLLTAAIALATLSFNLTMLAILIAATALSLFRMWRFGVHYARELFVEYLQVPEDQAGETS